ncbi:MAG: SDR family NAD(P)-dependent oxidoreductase [Treponema sp.]|nr:SDR family NAD(P)-dependent oxidoreductase [Treponema sp.]
MKKIAIVTGASSGMGKEFSIQISADTDADEIWLIARRVDKLNELCRELVDLRNEGIKADVKRPLPLAVGLDIAGRNGAENFALLLENEKKADEKSGGFSITMLVNNAGFGTYGPFEETSITRELDMIELNCTSLTGICGYALPYMNKESTIINTASLASFLPLGNFAVYGATKAFVLSFTMALAAEIKHRGIKVCALCPGPVSTEFADIASNGARKEVKHGLSAESVVAHCLRRAGKGKHTAIMAFKWKFKAAASRFVGRYTGAWFTYKYCKRPHNA